MSLRFSIAAAVAFALLLGAAPSLHAITVGQIDNFSVDLEGWSREGTVAGGATRTTTGGPAGAGDAYLRVVATGGGSGFGKLVTYNQAPAWSGNYLAAGVTTIAMDVNNLGANPVTLRIALGTVDAPINGGDWMQSTVGVVVPAGSGWTSIQFPIGAGNFTGAPFGDVIDSVFTFRLLHALSAETGGFGEPIAATLGLDNIRALGASIPGDFNQVGGVTGADLTKWRADYGGAGSDADGDNDSDGNDFLIWQRNLGQGTSVPAATAIPEPAGATLLTLAFAAALRSTTRLRRNR